MSQSDHDQRQRLDALGALARAKETSKEETVTASTRLPQGKRLRARPFLVVLLGALVLSAVGASVASKLGVGPLRAEATPVPAKPVSLSPRGSGFGGCIEDASWSPDASQIAILGYKSGCQTYGQIQQYASPHGLLSLADPSGHAASVLVPLDDLVLTAAQAGSSPVLSAAETAIMSKARVSLSMDYSYVLWAHDGRQLAILFDTAIPNGPPVLDPQSPDLPPQWRTYSLYDGLLLLDAQGKLLSVKFHPRPSIALAVSTLTWDVTQGSATLLATGHAPALTYRWDAGGNLMPQGLLTASGAVPTPIVAAIGNPQGDVGFSGWQPGRFEPVLAFPEAQTPTAFSWNSTWAAWSPDGRYLTFTRVFNMLSYPEGQNLAQVPGDWAKVILPFRDAGMKAAFAAVRGAAKGGQTTFLAWRPDGMRLAVYTEGTNATGRTGSVTIYDCRTGKVLGTVRGDDEMDPVDVGGASLLRWSPNGSRLLLVRGDQNSAFVWDQRFLPR